MTRRKRKYTRRTTLPNSGLTTFTNTTTDFDALVRELAKDSLILANKAIALAVENVRRTAGNTLT